MYYNIILGKLPTHVPSKLKIRTDFRESIKFELLMQDKEIPDIEKIKMALNLYYYEPSKIKDVNLAIKDILWFYKCGKEKEEINVDEESNIKNRQKQIYSYEFDAEYIYSAFMEQYNIDLNSISYLHWWKFKALFNSLNENVLFSKIMGYRAMDLTKIKDKDMKKYYKKLKKLYALPDMRTEEEKENDFAEAFS